MATDAQYLNGASRVQLYFNYKNDYIAIILTALAETRVKVNIH
jgi:hypothetical protein